MRRGGRCRLQAIGCRLEFIFRSENEFGGERADQEIFRGGALPGKKSPYKSVPSRRELAVMCDDHVVVAVFNHDDHAICHGEM